MTAVQQQRAARLRINYSIVILVILSVLMGAVSIGFSISRDHQTRTDFCEVVNGFISVPVPSPSNPNTDPSRERAYEWYGKFTRLGERLGCPKVH